MKRDSGWWDIEDNDIRNALPDIVSMVKRLKNDWQSLHEWNARFKRARHSIAFVLVDATLELVSVVRLAGDGSIISWPDAKDAPQNTTIDECEAYAMGWGLKFEDVEEMEIIVIGGDNTGASRAFWKGYSLSEPTQRHIVSVPQRHYRGAQIRIYVDIPTEENIGDVKTRPDLVWLAEEVERRRAASFRRLEIALGAWRKWPGDTYFDRRDEVFGNANS